MSSLDVDALDRYFGGRARLWQLCSALSLSEGILDKHQSELPLRELSKKSLDIKARKRGSGHVPVHKHGIPHLVNASERGGEDELAQGKGAWQ